MINLLHGDCLELMKDIPDKSIDMVLTDPPYGTTACKWDNIIPFEPMWNELKRITKDNGAICLFGSEPFSSHLRLSNIKMFKYDWYYNKKKPTGAQLAKKMPLNDCEIISVFYKKQTTYNPQPYRKSTNGRMSNKKTNENMSYLTNGKDWCVGDNVGEFGYPRRVISHIGVINNLTKDRAGYHPTQKPVALLEYLIKTYTLENETVLDFTMGSGSTGVASKNLNRKFIGIEKDEKYFNIARERIGE